MVAANWPMEQATLVMEGEDWPVKQGILAKVEPVVPMVVMEELSPTEQVVARLVKSED